MMTIQRDIYSATASYNMMASFRVTLFLGLALQVVACAGSGDSTSSGNTGDDQNSLVAPKTFILAPTAADMTEFSLPVGEGRMSLPYALQVDLGSSWTDDLSLSVLRANDEGVFVALPNDSDWQVVQSDGREVWSTSLSLGPGRYRITTRLQLLAEDSGAMVSYQATTRAVEIIVKR